MVKKSHDLESKLAAIQDIKNKHYVGSKEAYKIIQDTSKLYLYPEWISTNLNNLLRDSFTRLSYPATPARVYGVYEILKLNEEIEVDDSFRYVCGATQGLRTFLGSLVHSNCCFSLSADLLNPPSSKATLFFPYFFNANKEGLTRDIDFKYCLRNTLEEELTENILKIDCSLRHHARDFIADFLSLFDEIDPTILSEDYFRKRRAELAEEIYYTNIDLDKSMVRLFNDKIDHCLEYRREILSTWLSFNRPHDYESALQLIEDKLEEDKKRLFNQRADPNHPGIPYSEQMIRNTSFIRHILGSERNFVERFLKS